MFDEVVTNTVGQSMDAAKKERKGADSKFYGNLARTFNALGIGHMLDNRVGDEAEKIRKSQERSAEEGLRRAKDEGEKNRLENSVDNYKKDAKSEKKTLSLDDLIIPGVVEDEAEDSGLSL